MNLNSSKTHLEVVVYYPAGNIAYKIKDGIIAFYSASGDLIRVINLNKKTNHNVLLDTKDYLYYYYENIMENSNCKGEITYNSIGLKIKEISYGCNSNGKNSIELFEYNKYGIYFDKNHKYDSHGNLIETRKNIDYLIFGNKILLLNHLGELTYNIYNDNNLLIKQFHYQNNRRRATSYAQYDSNSRIIEIFTYDDTLKLIVFFQTFDYISDNIVKPAFSITYDFYKNNGILQVKQITWTNTTETRTSYNISIAGMHVAKMNVEDFKDLFVKIKEEFDDKKLMFIDKWYFTFNEPNQISEYFYLYGSHPESGGKTIFQYDVEGKRIRQSNFNYNGQLEQDYLFRYD